MADTAVNQMSSDAYVGHIQNMLIDDIDFFDVIHEYAVDSGNLTEGVTAVVNSGELTTIEKPIPVHTVTVRAAAGSVLMLPPLDLSHGNASLKFMFKTRLMEALLMYSEGATPDYVGVELVEGQLKVSANDGTGNVSVTVFDTQLNDAQWHLVDIRQNTTKTFNIMVDSEHLNLTLPASRSVFELMQPLQVGGILHETDSLSAQRSFAGCLATVTADGILYDLSSMSPYITPGCLRKCWIHLLSTLPK